MGLRERWRSGRAEFLVTAGSILGLIGNGLWVGITLGTGGSEAALVVIGLAMGFCVLTPVPIRRERTALRFALASMAATAVVLLTPPGIVGGGIALVGGLWGFLASEARARP